MARIEHVALWVDDLDAMATFYASAFGAVAGDRFEIPAYGFASRFLTFDTGARLELMSTRTLDPARHAPGAQRMGLTHLAISLGSEGAVDAATAKLAAAGATVLDPPQRTADGYYESVVLDPEGNRLELTV